jgi:5-methylcytosine-specific restriction endonuclease McrA
VLGDEEPSILPSSSEEPQKAEGRKTLSVRKRFLVFKRDRYKCRMCGRSGLELEVDHVVAVAQGGTDRLDNLQTLCFDCNRGKRQRLE